MKSDWRIRKVTMRSCDFHGWQELNDDGECPECAALPRISSPERDVLEAAEALVGFLRQHNGALHELEADLADAVGALRATKPQGVRPEEVEPGTRFRFVYGPFGEWRKVKGPHGSWFALREEDWILLALKPDDLIIALEE